MRDFFQPTVCSDNGAEIATQCFRWFAADNPMFPVFFHPIRLLRLSGLFTVMLRHINFGQPQDLLLGNRLCAAVRTHRQRGIDEHTGQKPMVDFHFSVSLSLTPHVLIFFNLFSLNTKGCSLHFSAIFAI